MNILLVEDEPPILREIKSVIESFQEDYRIIGAVTNGQAAIDYLTAHQSDVDLMITDLHIPVVDGLELLRYVSENMPHILTIILTGYSKFEYAKKAIAYGVSDYLLKPIDEDELRTKLKQAYHKVCLNYFKDGPEALNAEQAITNASKDLTYGYQLAVICLGTFPLQLNTIDSVFHNLWEQFDLASALEKHTDLLDNYWIINGSVPSEKNILFSFSSESKDDILQFFTDLFTPFMNQSVTITVAIDKKCHDVRTVHSSTQKLRIFLKENVRLEKSQVLFYQEESGAKKEQNLSEFYQCHARLSKLFVGKTFDLFRTELKLYLLKMKQTDMRQAVCFKLLYDLINTCTDSIRALPAIEMADTYAIVTDIIVLSDTYPALYENLLSIFNSFFEAMVKEMDVTDNRQIALIKIELFLKENYTRPINIKQLSDQFGFTPAYLSKIFREYKHMTPTDYITHLRIEKSKQMLQSNPTCKIKDLSNFVGYEDSLYFSKVFKKITGLSPKQYADSL